MTDATTHLLLPYLLASQAQKHVTVNEALRLLDGLVQLAVLDRDLIAPAGAPADGDRYIVVAGATGVWTGWDGSVAYWVDGSWMRLVPRPGWRAWVEDEATLVIWTGAAWERLETALGLIALAATTRVAEGPAGSAIDVAVAEELLSGLSGASIDSTITIPDRAIVLGVSTRTVTAITGATSYDCGIAGEPSKFGGSLGIAAGSTNAGVIGPQAFYATTPIRLTAGGGGFTGGAVRITIHYLLPRVPQS
ncbi:MAG TPA: DUF2793 domain-containing protein [Amaricoccus sp.]|uniref:DUF2793 domain-containing protein n=1 Tax=Amaricoccus sp. TaxID=1872485 RepID=UPI002CD592A6|nr:DUF2793 domain-containing protein [Amaricoccus sp.]HMQ65237.1 DUF2793 domain-containing protein [Arachnia sp.]HMR53999.1 DUF2793 domain-containing protein [Amaricoccus sp.]HMR59967.1 DUF2793 domain-containing protein [Amaricoccus sp.]HMU01007.1 DUF2793 domain-containing protein [Amaricoccus sp.]